MPSFSFVIKRAPSIGAGFDPLLTGDNITLSNDNRTVTHSLAGYDQALCNVPKSSGKLYFECIAGPNPLFQYSQVGVQNGNEALDVRLGSTNDGWGHMDNGRLYHNNSYDSNFHAWANGVVVMIAIDFSLGYMWCGHSGLFWGEGGINPDPASGENPLGTGLTGTLYPAIALNNATAELTICLGSGSQTYDPPAGFTAWD
jgi:hypothetical protein